MESWTAGLRRDQQLERVVAGRGVDGADALPARDDVKASAEVIAPRRKDRNRREVKSNGNHGNQQQLRETPEPEARRHDSV